MWSHPPADTVYYIQTLIETELVICFLFLFFLQLSEDPPIQKLKGFLTALLKTRNFLI